MALGAPPGLGYASAPTFTDPEPAMRAIPLAVLAATLLAPLAAAAATPPAAIPAPATPTASDERCLLTMAVLSASKDANTAHNAQLGLAYFAGRLKGRLTTYEFGAHLKPAAASLNGQDLRPEIQRCGALIQTSMDELDKALSSISPTSGPAPK
jgi:hypothetical protein